MKMNLMRTLLFGISLFAINSFVPVSAQDTLNYPVIGKIHRLSPELDQLIPKDSKIEVISSGFLWAEGPVWINTKKESFLLFSDIPRNSIYKWVEGKGSELYLKPAGYTGLSNYGNEPGTNGLILNAEGLLVSCEHGDRRIAILTNGGGKMTLADRYQGKRFNSPNDGTFHSNGDLYFTDPPYGLPKGADDPSRELDYCGVYRLSKTGEVTLLTKKMTRPNGIAFSPDEKILYVAQSDPKAAIIMQYPVKSDGTIGEGSVLYDFTTYVGQRPGLPDGLKVDAKGNLFATAPGGCYVLSPKGKVLGQISTGERTANCAWGNDGTVLYLTADTYLCRVKTTTKGAGW
jgi:gluconolactonase